MYINVQFAKFSLTDHIHAASTQTKNDCPDCVCVSECVSEGVCVIFCHVWLFVTLWTVAHQASLSMGFHRQE